MKKTLKYLSVSLSVFIVIFYFWGSSSTIPKIEYAEISSRANHITVPQTDTFSIVTYNIGYLSGMTNNRAVERTPEMYNTNLRKAVSVLSRLRPDILAVQEIDFDAHRSFHTNQMNQLARQVPFAVTAKAVNWDKRYVPFPYWPISKQFGKVVSGQAVLSNFYIESNKIITLPKPQENPFYYNAFYLDRLAQIVKIDIGTKTLVVINVHLEAFHPKTRDIQIQTVLRAYDQLAQKHPVILCGDFNSTPPHASHPWQNDHVIETLLTHPNLEMAISLSENQKNESAYYTFSSETPNRRIDYFFYNPNHITVLNARVITEMGQVSDHLPVWMKFIINPL